MDGGLPLQQRPAALAAVYHRGLKILTGEVRPYVYVDTLLKTLDPIYTAWTGRSWLNTNIDRLHDEVNDLKHTPHGLVRRAKRHVRRGSRGR